MRLSGTAQRLTIIVGDSGQWHHKPLFTEIVHRAHQAGLAGATVLHGVEGFGASSRIHTTRILSLSDDLPVVITIIDSHERIAQFLPQLDELVSEGLVILDDCEVIRYVGTHPDGTGGGHAPLDTPDTPNTPNTLDSPGVRDSAEAPQRADSSADTPGSADTPEPQR